MLLQGKRALVTGASRGIGAAIAKTLAAEGADVAITYEKSADRANEVIRAIRDLGRKAVAIQADSADVSAVQSSIEKTVKELGGLDILVNNAGVFLGMSLEEATLADWHRLCGVNLTGVFLGTKLSVPALRESGQHSGHGSAIVRNCVVTVRVKKFTPAGSRTPTM